MLPAMRRMELAGELTAGRFFSRLNSLQFASPSIAAELEVDGLGYQLCARSANNRLYFKGKNLLAISAKNGKELQIFIE